MEKRVLIIGAGIAGMTCALDLSRQGISTTLIEKENISGGLPRRFACKATEKCSGCGLCQFNEVEKKIKDEKIDLITSSSVENVEGNAGDFTVSVSQRKNGGINTFKIPAQAIVVATGVNVFDARSKSHLGYKLFKNVITGIELEENLRCGKVNFGFLGSVPQNIAFVQCVGSRDENIKNGYCSKVCCGYALRLANVLKDEIKEVNITIFYMDLQTTGKDISTLREETKDKFTFINSLPTYIREKDGKLKVRYEDIPGEKMGYQDFDLVVLSVGIVKNKDNANIANILGVNLNHFGFFEATDKGETNQAGVFAAGTSTGPGSIIETITSAKNVVYNIISKLGG